MKPPCQIAQRTINSSLSYTLKKFTEAIAGNKTFLHPEIAWDKKVFLISYKIAFILIAIETKLSTND